MLSGVKPTGRPHIGNYFGAMKQFVELQNSDYDVFVFIADIHALNFIHQGKELQQRVEDLCLDYLAIGLDPEKITLYRQSDVQGIHTDLAWILCSQTTFPYAQRAHNYKDAVAKGKLADYSVGDFLYPMLMAADILLYEADVVPVGRDQQQHIEFTRDMAGKFNHVYGTTFTLPRGIISDDVGTIVGSDGRKMSKSYNNYLALFASEEETEHYITGVVMDSKGIEEKKNPDDYTLYTTAKLFCSTQQDTELRRMFEQGGVGYGDIKKYTAQLINDYLRPMREKRQELERNPEYVHHVLHKGGEQAKAIAEKKMREVREKIGFAV